MKMVNNYPKMNTQGGVSVLGEDAWAYLQSQFSNDMTLLEEDNWLFGFFLDHKGRIRSDGWVRQKNNGFIVESGMHPGEALKDLLESNVIADDVEIEVVEPQEGNELSDLERVEGFLPKMGVDLLEGELPQEGGMNFAVSVNKGCYLGQEVMMRLHTMGRVRRGLFSVILSDMPDGDRKVVDEAGKVCGELRSIAKNEDKIIGIGMMKIGAVEEAGTLRIGANVHVKMVENGQNG